jgi:hypothetical protein
MPQGVSPCFVGRFLVRVIAVSAWAVYWVVSAVCAHLHPKLRQHMLLASDGETQIVGGIACHSGKAGSRKQFYSVAGSGSERLK